VPLRFANVLCLPLTFRRSLVQSADDLPGVLLAFLQLRFDCCFYDPFLQCFELDCGRIDRKSEAQRSSESLEPNATKLLRLLTFVERVVSYRYCGVRLNNAGTRLEHWVEAGIVEE